MEVGRYQDLQAKGHVVHLFIGDMVENSLCSKVTGNVCIRKILKKSEKLGLH